MDTYFKIKTFMEFGLPVILFGVIALGFLLFVIWAYFDNKKIQKIDNYMKSNGYEYYLRNVASCGGKAWWAYRKGDIRIDTDDLYKMSFREVKRKFK